MALTNEYVKLSRRAARIMEVISREDKKRIMPHITAATSWDALPKWVQDIIVQEEKKVDKKEL